jgi:SAM-dependent methyltransferase
MIRTYVSHLPSNIDVQTEFPRWVSQYCDHTSTVLDVGAGNGRTGNVLRHKVACLVGIDPDVSIKQNPYLDEYYQTSIEDFSKSHGSTFDCLYMRFVLEHVTYPSEFLSSCRSLLKPNGMLFSVTPNLWHYFGIITKLSASLGIDDWLLEHLIGNQRKNAYHFPTAYRLNSIRSIRHTLEQTGFREVEFRCFDQTNRFEAYFPNRLCWFPSLYSGMAYMLKLPQIMGLIIFKATA